MRLCASLLLVGCSASFDLGVSGSAMVDAGPADGGGDPFECGARPLPPRLSTVSVVGDGTRASCVEEELQRAIAEGGNVQFECGSGRVEITLTSPIEISRAVVVDGEGRVSLSGGGGTRLLRIEDDASEVVLQNLSLNLGNADTGGAFRVPSGVRVWLDQVVLTSNEATGSTAPGVAPNAGGGAISVAEGGELVAVGTNFLNNEATFGGAIWSEGRIGLHAVRIRQNLALNGGLRQGGALAITAGEAILCDAELRDNRAGEGGGVFVDGASLRVDTSIFRNNPAAGADPRFESVGGAIAATAADVTVDRSTFDGNVAIQGGGAVAVRGGNSRWENLTLVENSASGGPGGAFSFDGGSHQVRHATFVNNQSPEAGSAISGEGVELVNSLISGTGDPCDRMFAGVAVAQTSGSECVPGALVSSELSGQMERTECGDLDVFVPSSGSAALGGGDPASCAEIDQCGEPRGASCDLGAVER
ncbi:MAG: choice-of-anchor Q domain-containing protein [Myxococcota bacterium]